MNCKLVLSFRSQFFHSRLFFSSQAKLRSTTQRLGMTLKVCSAPTQKELMVGLVEHVLESVHDLC